MTVNVWGEPVDEHSDRDPWWVAPSERLDHDEPDDPYADALDDETGDDLDGWRPGDPA